MQAAQRQAERATKEDIMSTIRHAVAVSAAFVVANAIISSAGPAAAQVPAGYPADYTRTIDGAKKEGRIVVYATTDAAAANPLIKDFQALYPGIQVDYTDLNSTELYSRFIAEL